MEHVLLENAACDECLNGGQGTGHFACYQVSQMGRALLDAKLAQTALESGWVLYIHPDDIASAKRRLTERFAAEEVERYLPAT